MDTHTIGMLLLGGLGLGAVVWVLHKIGKVLIALFEALAALAVVFLALWWLFKAVVWLFTQVVTYWRTSLSLLALAAWWRYWGWPSLVLTLGVIILVLTLWRWLIWCPSTPGRVGGYGLGGCAGRSMPPSCPTGCTPAA
jgi:DNA segregation ATPase FtsK/SpoIIIE, S-DNA-T family